MFRIAPARQSWIAALLALFLVTRPLHLQAASEVEKELRYKYVDKTLVLRNFYTGERLDYDSAGALAGGAAVGDWTTDGFVRISSLSLSGQRLTIQAERLFLINDSHVFQVQSIREKKKNKIANRLRIEVALGPDGTTAEKADAALSKIFLTAQDRIAELLPAYWKPCVQAASTGTASNDFNTCRFPPEFAAIPGVVSTSQDDPVSAGEAKTEHSEVFHIGKGVSPPKITFQPSPEFSEEARSTKFQGVVVLSMILDRSGEVRDIRVVKPLGCGLDASAVRTARTLRFKPSEKDGVPASVEVMYEVNFHLY
jgi:TonB family protein